MNNFTDDFFSNSNTKSTSTSTSTKKKKKQYDVDNFTSSFFEDYSSTNDKKTESSYNNDFYDEYNAFVDELNSTRVDYYNTLQKEITKKIISKTIHSLTSLNYIPNCFFIALTSLLLNTPFFCP